MNLYPVNILTETICAHAQVTVFPPAPFPDFLCQVGPGVVGLSEGDLVLPVHAFMGSWATARVWKEKDLLKVGPGRGAGRNITILI